MYFEIYFSSLSRTSGCKVEENMVFYITFEKSWTTWLDSVLHGEGMIKQIFIAAVIDQESLTKGVVRPNLVFLGDF